MTLAGPHCPHASIGQPVFLGRGESCTKQAPQPAEDVRGGSGRWPCFLSPMHLETLPPSIWMDADANGK